MFHVKQLPVLLDYQWVKIFPDGLKRLRILYYGEKEQCRGLPVLFKKINNINHLITTVVFPIGSGLLPCGALRSKQSAISRSTS